MNFAHSLMFQSGSLVRRVMIFLYEQRWGKLENPKKTLGGDFLFYTDFCKERVHHPLICCLMATNKNAVQVYFAYFHSFLLITTILLILLTFKLRVTDVLCNTFNYVILLQFLTSIQYHLEIKKQIFPSSLVKSKKSKGLHISPCLTSFVHSI